MEEIVESLLAKTNNNGFEFVQADLKNGYFIVRYFINNSHVRIVFSFKKPDSLTSVPSTSSWLPYNFSRTTMDSTRSQSSTIAFEYLSLDGSLQNGVMNPSGIRRRIVLHRGTDGLHLLSAARDRSGYESRWVFVR